MRKVILSASLLALTGIAAVGQTTATDFTASDCSSVSHSLFTELNSGKVVVLVWVMPCAACISDAKAGYDAMQSFATSHPDKVLYWLTDDNGSTSCSVLSSWAGTNGIGPVSSTVAFFGNSGNTINESNYGGTGMPHVVVMGGSGHHIYYNKLNGSNDGAAIISAINSALDAATGVSGISLNENAVTVFPNPAADHISVRYSLNANANVKVEVCDILGNVVAIADQGTQEEGKHTINVNFGQRFANGLYTLKLHAGGQAHVAKFTVAN